MHIYVNIFTCVLACIPHLHCYVCVRIYIIYTAMCLCVWVCMKDFEFSTHSLTEWPLQFNPFLFLFNTLFLFYFLFYSLLSSSFILYIYFLCLSWVLLTLPISPSFSSLLRRVKVSNIPQSPQQATAKIWRSLQDINSLTLFIILSVL